MISILLTHYNQKKYIKAAITSVLEQDDHDWELLICDDCSEESQYNFLFDYIAKLSDKRIKLSRNQANIGKIATLKKLIKEASSDICGLLDGDDALSKDAITVVKKVYVDNPDIGFTYSDQYLCDEWLTPREIKTSQQINKRVNFLQYFYFTAFRTFKKSVYYSNIELEERFTYSDDNDMAYKFEEVGKGFYINKALYYYRLLPFSMSHDPAKWQQAKIGHFQSMIAAMKRREETGYPGISRHEFKERIKNIRETRRRSIAPAHMRLLEFLYHYIKYHYFRKKITRIQGVGPAKQRFRFFKRLKAKNENKKYPRKFRVVFTKKKHLFSVIKSPSRKFAFINVLGNACTYLSYLVIKYDWNLPCDDVYDLVPDLIGYEHDGEYRVSLSELSRLRDYTRFVVYRDPVERFLSYYKQLPEDFLLAKLSMINFLNFIEETLNSSKWTSLDLRLVPQSKFLKNSEIDYVVKLDRLNDFLQEKFSIEPPDITNKSTKPDIEISVQCIEKIKSIYAEDYKILDKFKTKVF